MSKICPSSISSIKFSIRVRNCIIQLRITNYELRI
ncbi:MAG: hypothetical protein LH472_05165 [Pyrinomonadaceae bacterium]|nr:hypothetical protein [Pyrinomonadaceae bacterium]